LTEVCELLSYNMMSSIDEILLRQIEVALMEDIGPGDITTLACIEPKKISAKIVAKSDGVLSGLPLVAAAFEKQDADIILKPIKKDRQSFKPGDVILEIEGDSGAILTAERTALNFLGHLSGIATLTSKFVKEVEGTSAKILDTRKTTPGLRYLEKYAVTCGGGVNHRFGLFDMALIKDNHIAAAGSVRAAVNKLKDYLGGEDFKKRFNVGPEKVEIEVEVTDEKQLADAIDNGIKRLLLDNQSVEQLSVLVKKARKLSPDILLEASGNVSLNNVREIAGTGVDFISIGALTHSAASSDFSLKVKS
jgi:nicotinate-nucleotide pyrophosphorylase (carboxylating)